MAIVSVVLALWPRHWQLLKQDGSLLCTISTGWPSSEVEGGVRARAESGRPAKSRAEFDRVLFRAVRIAAVTSSSMTANGESHA